MHYQSLAALLKAEGCEIQDNKVCLNPSATSRANMYINESLSRDAWNEWEPVYRASAEIGYVPKERMYADLRIGLLDLARYDDEWRTQYQTKLYYWHQLRPTREAAWHISTKDEWSYVPSGLIEVEDFLDLMGVEVIDAQVKLEK